MDGTWKHCNICKKAIPLGARYYVCSVSTCNRKRTGMSFCSVECCDAHAPVMNHREYWAEERRAPTEHAPAESANVKSTATRSAAAKSAAKSPGTSPGSSPGAAPMRRRHETHPTSPPRAGDDTSPDAGEILVVTSKVKQYVRARSGMNTSDAVARALSHHVRSLCDRAIREAERAERKTVMDRDLPPRRR